MRLARSLKTKKITFASVFSFFFLNFVLFPPSLTRCEFFFFFSMCLLKMNSRNNSFFFASKRKKKHPEFGFVYDFMTGTIGVKHFYIISGLDSFKRDIRDGKTQKDEHQNRFKMYCVAAIGLIKYICVVFVIIIVVVVVISSARQLSQQCGL